MSSAPRHLLVVRHGVTDHNAAGIWQGHLDVPLNPAGLAQAQQAAELLAQSDPAFVVASDLARAHRTAAAIAEATGRPLRTDARLREIHVGDWQGRSLEEVAEIDPDLWTAIRHGADLPRGRTGETVAAVATRTRPAVRDAVQELAAGETGILVTHGVTARALVADLVGLDQGVSWRCLAGLHNCHWADLEETGDSWRIRAWNVGPSMLAPASTQAIQG